MKKLLVACIALPAAIATSSIMAATPAGAASTGPASVAAPGRATAPGPLPDGWRKAEWWDLDGRDRQELLADFNGDGGIDFATTAVRTDGAVMGLFVWYAGTGARKWLLVEQQKRPQAPLNVRLETIANDQNASQSSILYCKLASDCSLFTWDEQRRRFQRSAPPRKVVKGVAG